MTALLPWAVDDTPPPLLTVSGLGVSFGPVRALDGVDLSVQPGELIALAGENGAGKTTLVRCIAGDIAPASGEIFLAGKKVAADPVAAARQGIAVVWQDLALCDNLDVAANVLLGRETRRLMLSESRFHAAAASVFESLHIPQIDTTRNVRTLSGGQRQLVAVARAMRQRPRLLVLDEPTASLGVKESAQVETLITTLREQGTTILLACHDIDQMFRLADRILVLRQGRIVADLEPRATHPDDVVALLSGQQVDASARMQLTRLHGLADRLVSADPSSSLSLILSALGAALSTEHLCIHLVTDQNLICAASLGFSPGQLAPWSVLPFGSGGGPVGLAAAAEEPVVEADVRASAAWADYGELAASAGIASSWSVPVLGPGGLSGVITVFRGDQGVPQRDELDLVTLYAGYAASAVERDRLLDQVTSQKPGARDDPGDAGDAGRPGAGRRRAGRRGRVAAPRAAGRRGRPAHPGRRRHTAVAGLCRAAGPRPGGGLAVTAQHGGRDAGQPAPGRGRPPGQEQPRPPCPGRGIHRPRRQRRPGGELEAAPGQHRGDRAHGGRRALAAAGAGAGGGRPGAPGGGGAAPVPGAAARVPVPAEP